MLTPSLPPLGRASPNAVHCLTRTPQRARLRDKPGGLVVDYLGLADQLKHALANYTESGGKGDPTYDTKQAIAIMLEKHGIACDMLHGSDWQKAVGDGKKTLFALPALQEHILELEDGKTRWNQVVTELSRALMNAPAFTLRAAFRQFAPVWFEVCGAISAALRLSRSARLALCAASDEATEIRDDVALLTHPPPLGGFALRAACGSLSRLPPVGSAPSHPGRAEQAAQRQPQDARADRRGSASAREQSHHDRRAGDRRLHRRRV